MFSKCFICGEEESEICNECCVKTTTVGSSEVEDIDAGVCTDCCACNPKWFSSDEKE